MISKELGQNHYLVSHTVEPGEDGLRLDAFLKIRYRRRSREAIQRSIWSAAPAETDSPTDSAPGTSSNPNAKPKNDLSPGAIQIIREGRPHLMLGKLKPSMLVFAGDEIRILSERRPEPPVNFDYKIIHEDDAIFVISKPPNLPVHPAGKYFFNTLLVHLKTHGHQEALKSEREYHLAHRIDRETSGLLVLAKNREVCAHLASQFADRSTEKTYLAIIKGHPTEDLFESHAPMRRAQGAAIELKMEVCSADAEGAQSALTRFEVVRRVIHPLRPAGQNAFTLVRCFPKTGRQHQIRLHLEALGHPIVGDKVYGVDERDAISYLARHALSAEAEHRLILPRHALHAASLTFEHPTRGERLEYHAPLTADLEDFLALCRPVAALVPSAASTTVSASGLALEPAPIDLGAKLRRLNQERIRQLLPQNP